MTQHDTTVIIGAGPYGLAVAAHLKARGVPVRVFGKTMELWKKMPPGLCLKSVWGASSLSDPTGEYSIDRYTALIGSVRKEPIPLAYFLNYAHWFQQNTVPDIDQSYVSLLAADGTGFHLELDDGRTIKARDVVVAAGVAPFMYVPDAVRDLPKTLVSHNTEHTDLSCFAGCHVAMLGKGQSALEYAALLHEAGAQVELLTRGEVRWHSKILYERVGPLRHLFYPATDVGPPGINWLVTNPDLYRHYPEDIKGPLHRRAILPGGAKWLRPRFEGHVKVTEHVQLVRVTQVGPCARLELSDGSVREVDHLFLGTGYKADFDRLTFIDPPLRQCVRTSGGFPVLDAGYESSVPHLRFVGLVATHTFGPTARFIAGTKSVGHRVAQAMAPAH